MTSSCSDVAGSTNPIRTLLLLRVSLGFAGKPPLPVTINSLPTPCSQGFCETWSLGSPTVSGSSSRPLVGSSKVRLIIVSPDCPNSDVTVDLLHNSFMVRSRVFLSLLPKL